MGQLRMTFIGIGLFVNRPMGLTVVLPAEAHGLKMTGSFGEVSLAGADVRITRNNQPLPPKPTGRASTEYIPHLDHIFGRRVNPPDLFGPEILGDLNARISLTGGALQGLPALAYNGLLRDVIWMFDPAGNRSDPYGQKLTDASIYRVDLPNGDYAVEVETSEGTMRHPFTIGDTPQDIAMFNEDSCPGLPQPDYSPEEASAVFILAGVTSGIPAIRGIPSTAAPRASEGARARLAAENPTGCACDPICPHFQVDVDA